MRASSTSVGLASRAARRTRRAAVESETLTKYDIILNCINPVESASFSARPRDELDSRARTEELIVCFNDEPRARSCGRSRNVHAR